MLKFFCTFGVEWFLSFESYPFCFFNEVYNIFMSVSVFTSVFISLEDESNCYKIKGFASVLLQWIFFFEQTPIDLSLRS